MVVSDPQTFIDSYNAEYEKLHFAFEEQFWGTKMALSGDYNTELLTSTKSAMEDFLKSPARLADTEEMLKKDNLTEEQTKVLKMFQRTFKCYLLPSDEASKLREDTMKAEGDLEGSRNKMKLGYTVGDKFTEASSVGLRNVMRVNDDESHREAAWTALRSIGDYVLDNGFIEIIKKRNKLAKMLGYEDYYDYKVTQAEGTTSKFIFFFRQFYSIWQNNCFEFR